MDHVLHDVDSIYNGAAIRNNITDSKEIWLIAVRKFPPASLITTQTMAAPHEMLVAMELATLAEELSLPD